MHSFNAACNTVFETFVGLYVTRSTRLIRLHQSLNSQQRCLRRWGALGIQLSCCYRDDNGWLAKLPRVGRYTLVEAIARIVFAEVVGPFLIGQYPIFTGTVGLSYFRTRILYFYQILKRSLYLLQPRFMNFRII